MGWFQSIVRRFKPEQGLAQVADQLAEHCFEAVWQRVQGRVMQLAPVEARGYIRARAATVLRARVTEAATKQGVASARIPQLYSLSVEALIQRVQAHSRSLIGRVPVRRAA